jgi:serine/threonine-protein kinase RsbW
MPDIVANFPLYWPAVIVLRVPPSLEYRDLALRAVAAACKLVTDGQGGRAQFDDHVVSAFGEAFNNVALHGFRDRPRSDVNIEIETGPDWLTIRMIDRGSGFDFDSVPEPDLDALPEAGLGVFIIKSFMDQVDYRRGAENVLTMTKRLPREML